MGNKLSHPLLTPSEREFYIQVKHSLVEGKFKFRKGLLKRFVHWVFKQFPSSKSSSISSDVFWDKVGRQLNIEPLNRDLSVAEFFPLFQWIIK